ncbi:putative quinol monooxygenase [Emticicia sp. BO119]|uniref:putative quinol monooxygenase n=1 Tax=Emticicia sp. BO119 TaxID=2757768 RepID=UPI0015EFE8D3|nr:putative quinol monooxygenase [Emticicia sp. BO119]MBA4851643.1 antibiotic biosynthesis monooxygenase [Emticicia sp. BO119]
MLTVIAKIIVRADRIDEAKSDLLALIAPTLEEEGCIDYVLHQSNDNPQLFFFYENWTDKESLENHLANEHVAAFSAKAEDLLVEPAELFFLSKV